MTFKSYLIFNQNPLILPSQDYLRYNESNMKNFNSYRNEFNKYRATYILAGLTLGVWLSQFLANGAQAVKPINLFRFGASAQKRDPPSLGPDKLSFATTCLHTARRGDRR